MDFIYRGKFCLFTDNDILFLLVPLVKQGQSIHQIYLNHKDELMCSEETLYNYVDACLFDIRNIDLPRKVKYRPRYKEPELKVDRGCRVGRNYHNYEVYMERHSASIMEKTWRGGLDAERLPPKTSTSR